MPDLYRLLAQEIIVRALKDYQRGDDRLKMEVKRWIQGQSESLLFCAKALGMQQEQLAEAVKHKIAKIDQDQ
jgi:hypothetical protein